MVKVITYGTYDLLHYGHIKLLERAKALGDYLIVGITADDFDKTRGKINVQQTLMERVEAVRATGLADEIIIEQYEGQKIDDIKRYEVDIFTVGSDWIGKFDYLNEFCQVIYLPRTQGISSTDIRKQNRTIRLGIVGERDYITKFIKESLLVNGTEIVCIYSQYSIPDLPTDITKLNSIEEMVGYVDAVYIASNPSLHCRQIEFFLNNKIHVLCESPISLSRQSTQELTLIAQRNGVILAEALKTAYSTAYYRLLLLLKSGIIGDIVSVDSTCTSLREIEELSELKRKYVWNSITAWGPTGVLPVFQILGTNYKDLSVISKLNEELENYDDFTKMNFTYDNAVASVKVGKGIKSEGELIISGTKGYVYIPAPWWKTDYYEVRFENPQENKRYFYQLEGEGIRYEIVEFVKSISNGKKSIYLNNDISLAISEIMDLFYTGKIIKI